MAGIKIKTTVPQLFARMSLLQTLDIETNNKKSNMVIKLFNHITAEILAERLDIKNLTDSQIKIIIARLVVLQSTIGETLEEYKEALGDLMESSEELEEGHYLKVCKGCKDLYQLMDSLNSHQYMRYKLLDEKDSEKWIEICIY